MRSPENAVIFRSSKGSRYPWWPGFFPPSTAWRLRWRLRWPMCGAFGSGCLKGNVSTYLSLRCLLTAAVFSLYLARKNRSIGELVALPAEGGTQRVTRITCSP